MINKINLNQNNNNNKIEDKEIDNAINNCIHYNPKDKFILNFILNKSELEGIAYNTLTPSKKNQLFSQYTEPTKDLNYIKSSSTSINDYDLMVFKFEEFNFIYKFRQRVVQLFNLCYKVDGENPLTVFRTKSLNFLKKLQNKELPTIEEIFILTQIINNEDVKIKSDTKDIIFFKTLLKKIFDLYYKTNKDILDKYYINTGESAFLLYKHVVDSNLDAIEKYYKNEIEYTKNNPSKAEFLGVKKIGAVKIISYMEELLNMDSHPDLMFYIYNKHPEMCSLLKKSTSKWRKDLKFTVESYSYRYVIGVSLINTLMEIYKDVKTTTTATKQFIKILNNEIEDISFYELDVDSLSVNPCMTEETCKAIKRLIYKIEDEGATVQEILDAVYSIDCNCSKKTVEAINSSRTSVEGTIWKNTTDGIKLFIGGA